MEGLISNLVGLITGGGPISLVAFLLLCVICCGYVCNYLIRIVISTAERQIASRDATIKEKDELIDKAAENLIAMLNRYHETNTSLKEGMVRIEAAVARIEVTINDLRRSK